MADKVANFDVAHICDECAVYMQELLESVSARQAEFQSHDRERAKAYIGRVKALVELFDANPLDLPASHPQAYPVKPAPPAEMVDDIQNTLLKGVICRLSGIYTEMINSQSRDGSSSLHPQDKQRIIDLCDATVTMIENITETLDMPETPGPNVVANANNG